MESTKRELAAALRKALDEKLQNDDVSVWELLSKAVWLKLLLELNDQMGKFGEALHLLNIPTDVKDEQSRG